VFSESVIIGSPSADRKEDNGSPKGGGEEEEEDVGGGELTHGGRGKARRTHQGAMPKESGSLWRSHAEPEQR